MNLEGSGSHEKGGGKGNRERQQWYRGSAHIQRNQKVLNISKKLLILVIDEAAITKVTFVLRRKPGPSASAVVHSPSPAMNSSEFLELFTLMYSGFIF